MAKKKREDRSTSEATSGFESPFAKLAALKASLPAEEAPVPPSKEEPATSQEGAPPRKAIVRRERAGRGGRTVTKIEGLGLDEAALATLCDEMKRDLGCGAFVEDGAVVLQGDLEERAAAALARRGVPQVVRATRKGGKS